MNRGLLLALLGLGAAAAAVLAVATVLRPADAGDRSDSTEVTALRARVEELRREVRELRDRTGAIPVAASNVPTRETAPAAPAPETAAASPGTFASVDREAIRKVIQEEREEREREREEQQRRQQRERTAQRVKATAERVGIDGGTTESLVRAYVSSLDREDDVRKAYPIADMADPNLEKRRMELQALWQERDAQVAALLPPDKKEQWERQTRWLDRAREFADAFPGADLDRPRPMRQRERRDSASNPAGAPSGEDR